MMKATPDKAIPAIRTLRATVVSFGAMLSLTACDDEPSYRLRWKVAGDAALTTPAQCSRAGIFAVEVTTFDDARMLDQRVYPCFPTAFEEPDGTVPGPSVGGGNYDVVVRGLRRDGIGWANPLAFEPAAPADLTAPRCEETDVGPACPEQYLVCDCQQVVLDAGSPAVFDDFSLTPPGECDDGIDNDKDGLVDTFDPGCRSGQAESDSVDTVQLRIDVGFLGNNPNVQCAAVGAARFVIAVDGEQVSSPSCTLAPIFLAIDAEAGRHEISIVAVAGNGEPVTVPKTTTIEVGASGGFFEVAADFGDADFLEPIVDEASFLPQFVSYEGAPFLRGCAPGSFGQLELTGFRLTVRDAHGGMLSEPVTLTDGTVLDGETPLPCTATVLETMPLSWGGYLLELEALSSTGEVCFSNADAPEPLAPGEPFIVEVPRVLVQEGDAWVPPAGCEDCQSDADCPESTCENRMCRLAAQ